jgi:hypothetical protein
MCSLMQPSQALERVSARRPRRSQRYCRMYQPNTTALGTEVGSKRRSRTWPWSSRARGGDTRGIEAIPKTANHGEPTNKKSYPLQVFAPRVSERWSGKSKIRPGWVARAPSAQGVGPGGVSVGPPVADGVMVVVERLLVCSRRRARGLQGWTEMQWPQETERVARCRALTEPISIIRRFPRGFGTAPVNLDVPFRAWYCLSRGGSGTPSPPRSLLLDAPSFPSWASHCTLQVPFRTGPRVTCNSLARIRSYPLAPRGFKVWFGRNAGSNLCIPEASLCVSFPS